MYEVFSRSKIGVFIELRNISHIYFPALTKFLFEGENSILAIDPGIGGHDISLFQSVKNNQNSSLICL